MPNLVDKTELKEIETPKTISSKAKDEAEQLESPPYEQPPNSVTLCFGRFCNVRWHAESGAPIFCFMTILALLLFGIFIALTTTVGSVWNFDTSWAGDVFKFVGQALLTLVGAVVGASATAITASRSRKPTSKT